MCFSFSFFSFSFFFFFLIYWPISQIALLVSISILRYNVYYYLAHLACVANHNVAIQVMTSILSSLVLISIYVVSWFLLWSLLQMIQRYLIHFFPFLFFFVNTVNGSIKPWLCHKTWSFSWGHPIGIVHFPSQCKCLDDLVNIDGCWSVDTCHHCPICCDVRNC